MKVEMQFVEKSTTEVLRHFFIPAGDSPHRYQLPDGTRFDVREAWDDDCDRFDVYCDFGGVGWKSISDYYPLFKLFEDCLKRYSLINGDVILRYETLD